MVTIGILALIALIIVVGDSFLTALSYWAICSYKTKKNNSFERTLFYISLLLIFIAKFAVFEFALIYYLLIPAFNLSISFTNMLIFSIGLAVFAVCLKILCFTSDTVRSFFVKLFLFPAFIHHAFMMWLCKKVCNTYTTFDLLDNFHNAANTCKLSRGLLEKIDTTTFKNRILHVFINYILGLLLIIAFPIVALIEVRWLLSMKSKWDLESKIKENLKPVFRFTTLEKELYLLKAIDKEICDSCTNHIFEFRINMVINPSYWNSKVNESMYDLYLLHCMQVLAYMVNGNSNSNSKIHENRKLQKIYETAKLVMHPSCYLYNAAPKLNNKNKIKSIIIELYEKYMHIIEIGKNTPFCIKLYLGINLPDHYDLYYSAQANQKNIAFEYIADYNVRPLKPRGFKEHDKFLQVVYYQKHCDNEAKYPILPNKNKIIYISSSNDELLFHCNYKSAQYFKLMNLAFEKMQKDQKIIQNLLEVKETDTHPEKMIKAICNNNFQTELRALQMGQTIIKKLGEKKYTYKEKIASEILNNYTSFNKF